MMTMGMKTNIIMMMITMEKKYKLMLRKGNQLIRLFLKGADSLNLI